MAAPFAERDESLRRFGVTKIVLDERSFSLRSAFTRHYGAPVLVTTSHIVFDPQRARAQAAREPAFAP